jgi:hypothetical protein
MECVWKNLLRRYRRLLNSFPGFRSLVFVSWSWRRDLNPRPPDYKSGALPTELRQQYGGKDAPSRKPIPLIPARCPGQLFKVSQGEVWAQPAVGVFRSGGHPLLRGGGLFCDVILRGGEAGPRDLTAVGRVGAVGGRCRGWRQTVRFSSCIVAYAVVGSLTAASPRFRMTGQFDFLLPIDGRVVYALT